jgi:hypothetical protein
MAIRLLVMEVHCCVGWTASAGGLCHAITGHLFKARKASGNKLKK